MSTRIGALIEFRVSQRKMKCGRSSPSNLHNRQVGSISFWMKADLVDWNRYDPFSNFSLTGTLVSSLTDFKGILRTGGGGSFGLYTHVCSDTSEIYIEMQLRPNFASLS